MRLIVPALTLLTALPAFPQTPASTLWAELAQKRADAGGRLEFDVTRTFERVAGSYSTKWSLALDVSRRVWRESAEGRTTTFDGVNVYTIEDGGAEFLRGKRAPKQGELLPPMYRGDEIQLAKLTELRRQKCTMGGEDRECVVLEAPLKPWIHGSPGRETRMVEGVIQLLADPKTGLLVAVKTAELLQNPREKSRRIVSYSLRGFSPEALAPETFRLPDGLREVKSFSPWRSPRIVKALSGKPAPEINAFDLKGERVSLAALAGKIVLLDFWATWCPPCREDAPALEKLFQRYGERDLAIVGIAVGEGREAVLKYFGARPHSYPNVMANENELPPPYHVEALPTYVVIGRDGAVVAATEGNQGFSELRRILKKAGLDVD